LLDIYLLCEYVQFIMAVPRCSLSVLSFEHLEVNDSLQYHVRRLDFDQAF